MAGLGAAEALVRLGADVTVLEARPEPGGRVRTLRQPFSGTLHAEAGATFISGHHRRVIEAARRHGLTLVPFQGDDFLATYVGPDRTYAGDPSGPFEWPFELSPDERAAGYYGLLYDLLSDPLDDLGDPLAADWPPPRLLPLDRLSFGDFLRNRGASEGAIQVLRQGFIGTWGDGPDSVSALFMLQAVAAHTSAFELFRIADGNDRLPQAMAGALGDRIQYGAEVHRLAVTPGRARVLYTRGGTEQSLGAEAVVVALPPASVRRIEFDPPLPPARHAAFEAVSSTPVVRTYLELSEAPWSPDHALGAWCPAAAPAGNLRHATVGQPGPGVVVESFSAGPLARQLGALSEGERSRRLVEFLSGSYPRVPELVRSTATLAWHDEPHAWGAYAWPRPGDVATTFPLLRQPHGVAHFAGDHISSWNGWMEGALASGYRAVTRIASPPSTTVLSE